MLMLSRRVGERICIGNTVVVTVVGAKGGRICLGIEAPDDVPVDREEVWDRKNAGSMAPLKTARPR